MRKGDVTGDLVARFRYDALDRRINKQSSALGGFSSPGQFYFYDGNRVIEARDLTPENGSSPYVRIRADFGSEREVRR